AAQDRLHGQLGDHRADGVVGGGVPDADQVLLRVLRAPFGAARVEDRLPYGRVGRGGELVDAVRVERRGDQLGALQGQLEQLTLGGVHGVAQGEGGAAGGGGCGGLRPLLLGCPACAV